ncbi:MAG: Gmad2 immunoglobulin-like domain-containing protein [Bacillota bacterium]
MKKVFLIAILLLISLGFVVGCNQLNPGTGEPDPKLEGEDPKIVVENEIFKIFSPAPGTKVQDKIIVKGLARIWEATVQYEFEDGHFILDKGFVTASEGAPAWGEFEIVIGLDDAVDGSASVVLYEASAKDGSRLNELIIPVNVEK